MHARACPTRLYDDAHYSMQAHMAAAWPFSAAAR
jgi:hypothetical protein